MRRRKHVTIQQLELYYAGTLRTEEAQTVEKHILSCRRCSSLAARHNPAAKSVSGVPGHLCMLTPRERQVALCVADGLSTKQIAGVLEIRPRTVDLHRKAINEKLGVNSAAMLTRLLIRAGIISP